MIAGRLLKSVLIGTSCVLALAGAAVAQTRDYNVPAGSLKSALDSYAKQSGLQVLYRVKDLDGVRSAGVHGAASAEDAITRVLQGTPFIVRRDSSGALAIMRGETAPQGDAPAGVDEAEASMVEEVIVSATKRDESIMQVPVSMTAVTASDIERIGAKTLEELAKSVPGVVIRAGPEAGDKTFVIRGISSGPTVAVYLDDTPITVSGFTPDLKLFDVAQVEFLRGPQGTLFGSSSMGGAIRYVAPTPSFGAVTGMVKVEGAQIQDGGQDYEAQGVISGPIISDKLAFRASAFASHDGGYIDLRNEDTGAVIRDNINTIDSYGGRLVLKALVGESFDATLSAIFQQQNSNQASAYYSIRGMDVPVPMHESRVARTNVYRDDRTFMPNLTVNADLGFAKLTSSTSYFHRNRDAALDFSYYMQRAFELPNAVGRDLTVISLEDRTFQAWTQEVRLASQGDGPFEWIVGAFYSRINEQLERSLPTNLGTIVPDYAALLPLYDAAYLEKSTQKAVFGEISYTIAQKLKLTAGLRLSDLSRKTDLNLNGLFNGGATKDTSVSAEKPVTPKFSAQYTLSPDAMIYVSVAKGFREGGANNAIATNIPACVAALAALGLTEAPLSYDTDTVWSYEVGTKLQTSDRRFRFIGSVYRIDWDGIQQGVSLGGGCGGGFVGNFGTARSKGFEVESSWRATDNLRLDLAVGYTDARLTEDLILGADPDTGPILAAPAGRRLSDVPEWTAMLAAQYQFQPLADWQAYLRGEVQYISGSKQSLGTPSDDPRSLNVPAFSLVNLRLGASQGPYEVSLFVNNLFDDDTAFYKTYGSRTPGPAFDGYEAQRNRPRVIGASLKRSF
jgi:iron complex outermembrane receptor protein